MGFKTTDCQAIGLEVVVFFGESRFGMGLSLTQLQGGGLEGGDRSGEGKGTRLDFAEGEEEDINEIVRRVKQIVIVYN